MTGEASRADGPICHDGRAPKRVIPAHLPLRQQVSPQGAASALVPLGLRQRTPMGSKWRVLCVTTVML